MSSYGTNTKKYAEAMKWRNWQTCELICEEHKELVETIKKLEAENHQLREEINSEWIRHIQEITEVQNSKDLKMQDRIEKLKVEIKTLNKIKQNRNELVEMNMNLQNELATTKDKLGESVRVIEFYANKDNYVPRRSNSDTFSTLKGDNEIYLNKIAYSGKLAREFLKNIENKQ